MEEREEFFRRQEDEAHLMAHIIEAASAACKALDDLTCRREQGEDAVFMVARYMEQPNPLEGKNVVAVLR